MSDETLASMISILEWERRRRIYQAILASIDLQRARHKRK